MWYKYWIFTTQDCCVEDTLGFIHTANVIEGGNVLTGLTGVDHISTTERRSKTERNTISLSPQLVKRSTKTPTHTHSISQIQWDGP